MDNPPPDPRVQRVLFATKDPESLLDGRPVPAVTTFLFRVCGNDPRQFEEATRLVELFIAKALEVADGRHS